MSLALVSRPSVEPTEQANMKHRGNNPKRRIAKPGHFTTAELVGFAGRARYEGSAHHKLHPADYGFHPPTSPRPSKSVCDDIRVIRLAEARELLRAGFAKGMVSISRPQDMPKYVWALDADGEPFEAKLGRDGRYHGYRLNLDERAMRDWVVDEWERRSA